MKVTELFRSIQGEGVHTGKMATFVRLAGCNLHCDWCDTKFSSWKVSDYNSISAEELYDKIAEFKSKLVVFTGGEPCIQANELYPLLEMLKRENYVIHIETNGTIFDKELLKWIDFWSFSPKLRSSHQIAQNSNKSYATPFSTDTLHKYTKVLALDKFQLKFVFSNQHYESDLADINEILERLDVNLATNIIIQPEGLTDTLAEYTQRGAQLAERFVVNGINPLFNTYPNIRIMPQVHKVFWMNKRKV